jgi:hypothetical protein
MPLWVLGEGWYTPYVQAWAIRSQPDHDKVLAKALATYGSNEAFGALENVAYWVAECGPVMPEPLALAESELWHLSDRTEVDGIRIGDRVFPTYPLAHTWRRFDKDPDALAAVTWRLSANGKRLSGWVADLACVVLVASYDLAHCTPGAPPPTARQIANAQARAER